MRIMWIVTRPSPYIERALHIQEHVGGGWYDILCRELSKANHLIIVYINKKQKCIRRDIVEDIECYGINIEVGKFFNEKKTVLIYDKIIKKSRPDIIHIWGTENPNTYAAAKAAIDNGLIKSTVVSIQGLVSFIVQHYDSFIYSPLLRFPTPYTLVYGGGVRGQKSVFLRNEKYERKLLLMVENVIGRTDWDKACIHQLNPKLKYFICNEVLRQEFYDKVWNINRCRRHSIFVSQAGYPIKGFHIAIEALRYLKRRYEDVILYTTGKLNLEKSASSIFRESEYHIYLRNLILKYDLKDNICFLGELNEYEMCLQYLNSHVFLSSSTIENSSNSIGEAMMLGLPIVASDVGGVKTFISHEKEGFLYQSDAPYMLADCVERVFEDDCLAERLGKNARNVAKDKFDIERNCGDMVAIYKSLLNCK